MPWTRWITAAALVVVLGAPAAAPAASERVAALQVGLRARGVYHGSVDGLNGPGTSAGVRRLQRRAGIAVDGVAGPRTRRALGVLGRHGIGSRPLQYGDRGFDVAALQFALESHGFPLSTVDGHFGSHTRAALLKAQRYGGLPQDGIAGPATRALLRRPPPTPPPLRKPILAPVGDRYGPRGARWHAGLDFPAPTGTPVTAAGAGRAVFVGYDDGYGLTVVLDHGNGLRTRYAHLRVAAVANHTHVLPGALIGRVGATGRATGPHLHFEVLLRGAATDPARALGL